jgi:hypothetical protein
MTDGSQDLRERAESDDLDESWEEKLRNHAQGAGGCAEMMDALSDLRSSDES